MTMTRLRKCANCLYHDSKDGGEWCWWFEDRPSSIFCNRKGEMAGIIKCPICGKNMLISKKVIETGKHKGEHLVSCFRCGFETYVKY